MPFTVHVPATTANLGPGFDCLGLALDLWNSVTFTLEDTPDLIEITGIGSEILPIDQSNLIYRSAKQLADEKNLSLPHNLHFSCQNQIPIASGLGSSASAVITGLIGAKNTLGLDICDEEILEIAGRIEGHADNACACLKGGLILLKSDETGLKFTQLEIQPITATAGIPDYSASTQTAREVLPGNIPLQDAVFNISQTARLIHTFQTGNYKNLADAMRDKLHQNYRFQILPGAQAAMQASVNAGAFGACLSGAGPGIIAFSTMETADTISHAIKKAYAKFAFKAETFTSECPSRGSFFT